MNAPGIDTKTLTPLIERALREAREVAPYGLPPESDRVTEFQLTEMADGSGRWAVLVTMHDGLGDELRFRVASPAPKGAPKWARIYTDYTVAEIGDES